jgi:hypothetical protein
VRSAISTILLLAAVAARAQAPASGSAEPSARRERAPLAAPKDLEPAVDVGGTRLAVAQRPPGSAPTAPVPADALTPVTPPGPSAAAAVRPIAAAAPARAAAARDSAAPAAPRSGSPRAMDSIDLGTTSITGNQELPKVLYIVPWKKSDLGDLVGRPVNTLLDEVLAPVDPEVFERHLQYYETLYGKKGQEE